MNQIPQITRKQKKEVAPRLYNDKELINNLLQYIQCTRQDDYTNESTIL